jgi:2-polyprenyl-6-methoxyphenol hydroxylase-like FAD-dependent oxidoreductase
MKSQVLIVGAGPVGLTMAAELARYGVSVRIVDKSTQRTDKSKAVVLWSRTLNCSIALVVQTLSSRWETRLMPQISLPTKLSSAMSISRMWTALTHLH